MHHINFFQGYEYLGKVLFFLMPCSDLGSGGYYQNRVPVRGSLQLCPPPQSLPYTQLLLRSALVADLFSFTGRWLDLSNFSLEAATDAAI